MSRRGRLSRGCGACRKRKIRCDETQPECRQCIKAGWVCPRYDDVTERLFQNRTVADFQDDSSFAAGGNEILAAEYPRSCPLQQDDMHQALINDRAIDLFLASHVPRDTVFIRGCFEYLPEFRLSHSEDSGFSASLNAAALAAYGNTVQSTKILMQARSYLGAAIRCVNKALMSPNEAIKDTTVISIMLLATFETITCRDQKSLKDCDMHTKGATTIIELRGHQQFRTRLGMQLFVQMCGDISRGCLQRSVRVPSGVVAARYHAAALFGELDTAWKLGDLIIEVAEIRANIKEGMICTPDAIANALELDARLYTLATFVPSEHRFEIMQPHCNVGLVCGGYYHIYPSFWAAYFWNNLRTCRILLHQEICRQAEFSVIPDNLRQSRSRTLIHQLGMDICATVPQYSGYLPLLVPQDLMRRWIVDRVREIGRLTGIHQAFALADVLEKQERIHIWED
ncbi:putative C6 transcription factor [Cadophora sp. DSE1049]|nr:putative C6 transcription factor [Cadophora sp. DSE1049]